MPEKRGIWEALRAGVTSDEEIALNFLFPAKSKFEFLQMLTEQQPRAIIPWSVLGVFRRMYGSRILKMVQEEHNINKIAQERKGRLEGSEVVAAGRRKKEEEEKE